MRADRYRDQFDPKKTFIIRRPLRVGGEGLTVGEPFPKHRVKLVRLRQLFDQRALAYAGETGRQMTRPPNPVRPRLGNGSFPPPPVPIPDAWRLLSWQDLRRLAKHFAKVVPANKLEAEDAVQAEVDRRARDPR